MTAPGILAMKAEGRRIVCSTAYDALDGELLEKSGVDLVLVGDSVGNARLGLESTTSVTLDMMLHHTAAVRRGLSTALLVADLPFGSYQSSVSGAVDSAVALVRAGADAVKLEGVYEEQTQAIVKAGIPVMGHLGMTPQSHLAFGGFKVQGKSEDQAERILKDASLLQKLGCFAIVLELIPATLAAAVTRSIDIPTIGIGAGIDCDGEIQVLPDLLGLGNRTYRHSKAYINGRELFINALSQYGKDVRERNFPTLEQSS